MEEIKSQAMPPSSIQLNDNKLYDKKTQIFKINQ